MKLGRTALFVLGGAIVGVIAARMTGRGERSSGGVMPAVSDDQATSSSRSPRAVIARSHDVRQHDLAPADVRYDPIALRDEDELGIKEIFEREPRDPAFATIMESRIHAIYDTVFRELHLEGKIRGVHVECKTLSCYTYVQVLKEDVEQIYDDLNGILLGDVQMPSYTSDADPELAKVTIYNLYHPTTRDEARYKEFLEHMRLKLELVKQRHKER